MANYIEEYKDTLSSMNKSEEVTAAYNRAVKEIKYMSSIDNRELMEKIYAELLIIRVKLAAL